MIKEIVDINDTIKSLNRLSMTLRKKRRYLKQRISKKRTQLRTSIKNLNYKA